MSIILGVYPVIQLLILSSLMVMEANLTLHAITITLSTLGYFVVAFKNPGYFEGDQHDLPSIDDEIRKEQQEHSVIKEMDEEDDDKSEVVNGKESIKNVGEEFEDNQPQVQQRTDHPQKNPQPINQKAKTPTKSPNKTLSKASPTKTSPANPSPTQIQQKLIKQKFPTTSPQQLQKLTHLQQNHLQFKPHPSSTQIPHRYCRICKVFQPSRVRHCHQCQKCILTFDHHCPWMNNCIGERNRNLFWVYLLMQFVEFLLVLVDVGLRARETVVNEKRLYFFVVAVGVVTVVAFVLLVFHTYLMLKNFTTWEFVRWDRISYLSIYVYRKSSPFSYGLIKNLTDYFVPLKTPKQWTVNPQFLKLNKELQQKTKQSKSNKSIPKIPTQKTKIAERAQTQRAITSRNY